MSATKWRLIPWVSITSVNPSHLKFLTTASLVPFALVLCHSRLRLSPENQKEEEDHPPLQAGLCRGPCARQSKPSANRGQNGCGRGTVGETGMKARKARTATYRTVLFRLRHAMQVAACLTSPSACNYGTGNDSISLLPLGAIIQVCCNAQTWQCARYYLARVG